MIRRNSVKAFVFLILAFTALQGSSGALADRGVHKATSNLHQVLNGVSVTARKAGGDPGSAGKPFLLFGSLHVLSQVTIDADSMATGFEIHANMSDAVAEAEFGDPTGGTCSPTPPPSPPVPIPYPNATCQAVGVSELDFAPTATTSADGFSHVWPLDFRIVSPGAGGPNGGLVFGIQLKVTYAADGSLISAEVIDTRGDVGCLTQYLME